MQAKLEDMQKENKDDQDTLVAAWASRAQTKIPHPSPRQATDSSAPAVRTPRAHTSEEDVNALLKQLQAANAENAKLAEVVAGLQERQASLQALVDDRTSDTGSVPMSEHQQVVSQNKQLQAQLQQLRMDLELLYMDDQYATGANEGASMGIGASADGLSAGGPTSFMSTVHRLGALLGVSETQRASHVRFCCSLLCCAVLCCLVPRTCDYRSAYGTCSWHLEFSLTVGACAEHDDDEEVCDEHAAAAERKRPPGIP